MSDIYGTLSSPAKVSGDLSGAGKTDGNITVPPFRYPGIYTGPYVVIPRHETQSLPTGNLLATSNILVSRIPDPEYVQDLYYHEYTLAETGFNTWTPSTTAKTIVTSATAGTFVADMANYEYIQKWEISFDAAYNSGATLKVQVYKQYGDLYQSIYRRPNSWANIEAQNSNSNAVNTAYSAYLIRYYNSSGALTYAYMGSYGIYGAVAAPTFSSSTSATPTVTVKTPTISARCSTTYMSTARAAELDKANSIVTIKGELYRQEIPGKVRWMYDNLYERII